MNEWIILITKRKIMSKELLEILTAIAKYNNSNNEELKKFLRSLEYE